MLRDVASYPSGHGRPSQGIGLLVRHSVGTALPDETIVVSEEAVQGLEAGGVRWADAVVKDVKVL